MNKLKTYLKARKLAIYIVINRLLCDVFGHNNDMYMDGEYWMHKCKRCGKKEVLWKQPDYSLDKC